MKNLIKVLITSIVMMYSMSLKAQNVNTTTGIYLTEQDYKNNKLSYAGDNNQIRFHEFLGGKNITVVHEGKSIRLAKNGIFGYRLNNLDYRYFHNEAYRILDTAGFLLYSKEKLSQHNKGLVPVEQYFYSVNVNQPVLDLTIANLADSFPKAAGFRYSLQAYFHNDADLISFDRAENQYKIKYIYLGHKKVLAAHS